MMTPNEQAEHEQDMRSFRDEFIRTLARKLASSIYDDPVDSLEYEVEQISATLKHYLPGALECQYPVIEDQSRR